MEEKDTYELSAHMCFFVAMNVFLWAVCDNEGYEFQGERSQNHRALYLIRKYFKILFSIKEADGVFSPRFKKKYCE